MGKWGALAVGCILLILLVITSSGIKSVDGYDVKNGTITSEQGALPEDGSDPTDEQRTIIDREWRQVAVGNNTTAEVPLWVYGVIGLTLAGGTIMIIWSAFYYRRRRKELKRKRLEVSQEWEEQRRGTGILEVLILFVVPITISFAITMRVQVEVEWELSQILFLFIIITALVLAPFLYLLTLSFPLKRSWKKMDKPFDEVVEVVERALIRKGIPFRRLTSNEYKEKGANEKLCRIERLSGTRSYNVLFYDLDRDDQIIIVGEWGREEETRVNILICYDGERDEVLMNDVKKEIDWELRKLD